MVSVRWTAVCIVDSYTTTANVPNVISTLRTNDIIVCDTKGMPNITIQPNLNHYFN